MRFTIVLLLSTACSKGAPKTVKLSKLGVEIEIAGGIDHETGPAYVLNANDSVIRVEPASHPFTLDEAKQDQGAYHPKQLVAEALPDGWAIRYERDKTGHGVTAQRTIGGRVFECNSYDNEAESAAKSALAACKTLRASK